MKKTIDIKKFNLECSCGCGSLTFEYFDDEKDEISISYNLPAWYAYQTSTWERFKNAIKIIWAIVRGKEYRFYEVLIDDMKILDEFKKFVAELDNSTLLFDE